MKLAGPENAAAGTKVKEPLELNVSVPCEAVMLYQAAAIARA